MVKIRPAVAEQSCQRKNKTKKQTAAKTRRRFRLQVAAQSS